MPVDSSVAWRQAGRGEGRHLTHERLQLLISTSSSSEKVREMLFRLWLGLRPGSFTGLLPDGMLW